MVTIVDACSELGLELGADLTDELLAVAEGAGLDQLPAGRLAVLAGALGRAGHQPDELWLRAMHKALLVGGGLDRAGRARVGGRDMGSGRRVPAGWEEGPSGLGMEARRADWL